MLFQIAGIVFSYEPRFSYVSEILSPFSISVPAGEGLPGEEPPIHVELSEEEVDAYSRRTKEESLDVELEPEMLESFGIMRCVNDTMLEHDGMFLHAAAIAVDGKGYAFCAPSGTGKSTHLKLWKDLLGDKVTIINGDRPFLRWFKGTCYLCGSPWAGKEGWGNNTLAPLDGLIFLERANGAQCQMRRIPGSEALNPLFRQTIRPSTAAQLDACCSCFNALIAHAPLHALSCNPDLESAELAYRTLTSRGE